MSVEVDRIPALQLSLAHVVFDDHAGLERWLRVVALSLDGGDVLVTCEGDAEALRLPADALVASRLAGPAEIEDVDMNEWVSASYAGDVSSFTSAVVAQTRDRSSRNSRPVTDDPVAHYEGFYGGDLDAIIDALGGTRDARTRVLREAATRRHLTQAQSAGRVPPSPPAGLDDDDLIDTLGDWYVGDGALTDTGDI